MLQEAGNKQRDRSQQYPESDADKHRQHLDLLQLLLSVTQFGGHGVNCLRTADQVEDVTKLQAGAAAGYQLDACPVKPEITTS